MGRTARIATKGHSLCFIMPQEISYVKHMKEKNGIHIYSRERFNLIKEFNKAVRAHRGLQNKILKVLKHIDDFDER